MPSIPTYEQIDPRAIDWQWRALKNIAYNPTNIPQHHLNSGSVGSAKTILLAYVATRHCLRNPGASFGIGRLSMTELMETLGGVLHQFIPTHTLKKSVTSTKPASGTPIFTFKNGSNIRAFSWSDKNYQKFRSFFLSGFGVEEMTENKTDDFYKEMTLRVNRLPHVPASENVIVCNTNPDSPAHWIYGRYIEPNTKLKHHHVHYSLTKDNPFLPDGYIEQIESTLDQRMCRRMLHGEWLEIKTDVVYYEYNRDVNYREVEYAVDNRFPVYCSWDFNIGDGKPLSMVAFQYRPDIANGSFHFFDEVVVGGFRTEDSCEEALNRGFFDHPTLYIIAGDATGKNNDTRSKQTDYSIIKKFLSNNKNRKGKRIEWESAIARSNPPIRKRHNIVNGYCKNAKGQHRLFVYKKCPTLDKGLRLTKLVEGGRYIEDDKDDFQHITTACGYGILACLKRERTVAPGLIGR